MVDEPNSFDKALKDAGITGALSGTTDSIAKKAGEMGLGENTAKGIIPWVAGGAATLIGVALLQPINWLVKNTFKLARNVLTLGGLLEDIPIIGGLFKAIGDVIDTIGEYAGFIVPAIAGFIGYKAFQTEPSPAPPPTIAEKALALGGQAVDVAKNVGTAALENAPAVGAIGAVGTVAAAGIPQAPKVSGPITAKQVAVLESVFGGKKEFDAFHKEKFGKPVSEGIDPRLTQERANQLIKHGEAVRSEYFKAGTKATAAELPKPSLLRLPLNLAAKFPVLGQLFVGVPLKIFDFTAEKIFGKEPPMSRSERLKEGRSQTRGEMKSDSAKAAMREEISRRFGPADAPEVAAAPKAGSTPDAPDAPAKPAGTPSEPTPPKPAGAAASEPTGTPKPAGTAVSEPSAPAQTGAAKPTAASRMVIDGAEFVYEPNGQAIARNAPNASQSAPVEPPGRVAVVDAPNTPAAPKPTGFTPETMSAPPEFGIPTRGSATNVPLTPELTAPPAAGVPEVPATPRVAAGAAAPETPGTPRTSSGFGAVRSVGVLSTIPALGRAFKEDATTVDQIMAGAGIGLGAVAVAAPEFAAKKLAKLGPLGLVATPAMIEDMGKEHNTVKDYVNTGISTGYTTAGGLATAGLVPTPASPFLLGAAGVVGTGTVIVDASKTVYEVAEKPVMRYNISKFLPAIEEMRIQDQTQLKVRSFKLSDGYEVNMPVMGVTYPNIPSEIYDRMHDKEMDYNTRGDLDPLKSETGRMYRLMGHAKQHKMNNDHFLRWMITSTKYAAVHDQLSAHFEKIETYEDSARSYIAFAKKYNDEGRAKLIADLRKEPAFNGIDLEAMTPKLSDGKGTVDTQPKITAAKYPEAYKFLKAQLQDDFDVDALTAKQQHHVLRKAIPMRGAVLLSAGKDQSSKEYQELNRIHEQYSDFMKQEYVPYTEKLVAFEKAMTQDQQKTDIFLKQVQGIQKQAAEKAALPVASADTASLGNMPTANNLPPVVAGLTAKPERK